MLDQSTGLVQIQQEKHEANMINIFKVTNNDTRKL